VDRYGEDLMFCHEWKKWLIWNGSYWEIDKSDQVRGYAIDTARNIINEAENIEENGNNE
jgi:putative DNA primase/helicase